MRKWLHITFSTYGTWLPGDQRGFRALRHKIHSSGDYRIRPPAGEHAKLEVHSRPTMTSEPVTLTAKQREVCASAIVDRLSEKDCEVIAIAVGGKHVHIQVRMEDRNVKRLIGLAKQHASHQLRHELPGTIWAARCRSEPVRTRDHQTSLFHYIRRHREDGAFVWTIRNEGGRSSPVGT